MSTLDTARMHLADRLEEMVEALRNGQADAVMVTDKPFTGTPMQMLTAAFTYGDEKRVHLSLTYPKTQVA